MTAFTGGSFAHPVGEPILAAFNRTWDALGEPGTWWTAAERVAIVEAGREARRGGPRGLGEAVPALEDLDDTAPDGLSELAVEVVRRVATESSRITAPWAAEAVRLLGPGRYVELVALLFLTVPIDLLCDLMGRQQAPLPEPLPGEPSAEVPEGVAQEGAYVPWRVEGWVGPNVARALSYVPADNALRREMVRVMYDGEQFFDMVWTDRALSRPQIELVAARTSAVNECFY